MFKKWIRPLIILVVVLLIAVPVAAITYGEADEGEHPYVGLIVFFDADGNWLLSVQMSKEDFERMFDEDVIVTEKF